MGSTVKADKAKAPRKSVRGEPIFITKSELAHHLGHVATSTIDGWVRNGTIPPPHSRLGERSAIWLREHFREYVETGRWPESAFKRSG